MAQQIGSLYADITVNSGPYVAGMATVERVTARTTNAIRRDVGVAQASIDRFSKSANTGIKPYGLIAVSRAFERLNDRVSLLRGSLLATTAVFGGFTAAISSNLILRYADSYNQLSNQIRVVSKDSTDLAGQFAAIQAAADDSRASLSATATLYSRLSKAAPTRSGAEILEYVQTIQKALQLGGATAQEANSAAIQFSQAVASNRLGGDELRAVLETPLGLELAKGLDITIGKLRQLSVQGKLTADVILGALARVKGDVDQQFAKSTLTIDQSLVKADNRLTEYVGHLDHAYGITRLVSGSIISLADNLDSIVPVLAIVGGTLGSIFAGKFFGHIGKSAFAATIGATATAIDNAKKDVIQFTKEQEALEQQLTESTGALKTLKAQADKEFISKGDAKAKEAAEKRLTVQTLRRAEAEKALVAAQVEARKISTSINASALKAAEKLVNTEANLQATQERGVTIANQRAAAEARVAAARKQIEDLAKGTIDTTNAQQQGAAATKHQVELEKKLAEIKSSAGQKIQAIETKIAASKERSIKLDNEELNALARLNRAKEEAATAKAAGATAPDPRERIAAEKALDEAEKASNAELQHRLAIETQLGQVTTARDEAADTVRKIAAEKQLTAATRELGDITAAQTKNTDVEAALFDRSVKERIALTEQAGAADAKAAVDAAKKQRNLLVASNAAVEAAKAEIEAAKAVDEVTTRANQNAASAKGAKVSALEIANKGIEQSSLKAAQALNIANRSANVFRASISTLGKIGGSFVDFLGGPWGAAFAAATAALAIFGAVSARTAAQVETARKAMEENLDKLVQIPGKIGQAASESLNQVKLKAEIADTQDKLDAFKTALGADQAQIAGILNRVFAPKFLGKGAAGTTDFSGLKATRDAIVDIVDKGSKATLTFDQVAEAIKGIPALKILTGEQQDKLVRIVAEMINLSKTAKISADNFDILNKQLDESVGNLDIGAKITLVYSQLVRSQQEYTSQVEASSAAALDLLHSTQQLTKEGEIGAKTFANFQKLQKDHPEIVDTTTLETLAKLGTLQDIQTTKTKEWRQAAAETHGEYAELLETLDRFTNASAAKPTEAARQLTGSLKQAASDLGNAFATGDIGKALPALKNGFDAIKLGALGTAADQFVHSVLQSVGALKDQSKLTDDQIISIKEQVLLEQKVLQARLAGTQQSEREARIQAHIADLKKIAVNGADKGFDFRQAATDIANAEDKLQEFQRAASAIPKALAINSVFATGLGQQIPILDALIERDRDFAAVQLDLKANEAKLTSTLKTGREELFGRARVVGTVQSAYDSVSSRVLNLSKQFADSGGNALILKAGLADIRQELIGLGANSDALDPFLKAIEDSILASAKGVQAQDNLKKSANELFVEQQKRTKLSEYEVKLQDAQNLLLSERISGVKDNAEEQKLVSYVLEQINSHSEDWLNSTEATSGVFAKILEIVKHIAPNVDFSKSGLNESQLADVEDILRAQKEAAQNDIQASAASAGQLRFLKARADLVEKILEKSGSLKGIDLKKLDTDAREIANLQRIRELQDRISGAFQAGGAFSNQSALSQQADALKAIIDRYYDLEAVSNAVAQNQGTLNGVITAGITNLAGDQAGVAGLSQQYGIFEGELFAVAKRFLDGRDNASQLHESLKRIHDEMEKISGKSDFLDSFIHQVENAILAVAQLIGLKRTLDQNPVPTRAGTTGVRTVAPGTNVGVSRFGGADDNAGPIIHSLNSTQSVISFGADKTTDAINGASAAISGAVNDNSAAVSGSIINLGDGLTATIQAQKDAGGGLGTATIGGGEGATGLGGSAGTDRLLSSDDVTRQVISSSLGTASSTIVTAVNDNATSISGALSNLDFGTDRIVGSVDASTSTISGAISSASKAIVDAISGIASAISSAVSSSIQSSGVLSGGSGNNSLRGDAGSDRLSGGGSSTASPRPRFRGGDSGALQYDVPANSGYATDAANSFKFSGLGGSGSWAGRQLTFGGGDSSSSDSTMTFGEKVAKALGWPTGPMMAPDKTDAAGSGSSTSDQPIQVNITVKPILEGQRLSSQSRAEIKQAAAAGANAALRAYNGR